MDDNKDVLKDFSLLIKDKIITFIQGDNNTYYISIDKSKNLIKISKLLHGVITESHKTENLNKQSKQLLQDSLNKLYNTIILRRESKKKNYIRFSFTLIPEKIVQFIAKRLAFLFEKTKLIIFFLVSFTITLSFSFFILIDNIPTLNNWFDIIITYLILLLILIFHEFGHASASMSMNIKPREIGFGFYLIFPVLYANVTNIWILNKAKRIIVNLGGIYFQVIANVLLIIGYYIYPSDVFLRVISVNNFVCLYSLVPFLRNDGYWVYSDFFEIPNLMNKSQYYFLNLKGTSKVNIPLLLFSIGNTLFLFYIIYLYYVMVKNIYIEAAQLYTGGLLFKDISLVLFKALIISVFLVLFIRGQITLLLSKLKTKNI